MSRTGTDPYLIWASNNGYPATETGSKAWKAGVAYARLQAQIGADHPMQPVLIDKQGVLRFSSNAMVCAIYDGYMATEPSGDFHASHSKPDRSQLAQLLGCSLSHFEDLLCATDLEVLQAKDAANQLIGG